MTIKKNNIYILSRYKNTLVYACTQNIYLPVIKHYYACPRHVNIMQNSRKRLSIFDYYYCILYIITVYCLRIDYQELQVEHAMFLDWYERILLFYIIFNGN